MDRAELDRHLAGLTSRSDDGVLVLADWLQQQGHPWGELIVLQARGANSAAYLETHAAAILGALAAPYSHVDWERGFARRAVIGCKPEIADMVRAVEQLLAEPIARLIDTVVLGTYIPEFGTWRDWGHSTREIVDPWADLEKLAAAIPSKISRIGLGGWPAPAAAGYVAMPSFDRVTEVLGKRLTALELTGWARENLGVLALPEVTELAVRFARGNAACFQALGGSMLPKLERLSLWLGGESRVTVDDVYSPLERSEVEKGQSRYPETFSAADLEGMDPYGSGIEGDAWSDDIQIMFEAAWARGITHLEIGTPEWTVELIDMLVWPDFLKQLPALKSLTISGGTLTKEAVANLQPEALAHLEFQITSLVHETAVNTLATRFVDRVFPKLSLRTKGEIEDFHFRYVATVE